MILQFSARCALQDIDTARQEAIDQAIAAKDAAETELAEERGIRERMLQLAAEGQLPGQAAGQVRAATPATPGDFCNQHLAFGCMKFRERMLQLPGQAV